MLSMPTFRSLVGLKAFGTFREVVGFGFERTTATLFELNFSLGLPCVGFRCLWLLTKCRIVVSLEQILLWLTSHRLPAAIEFVCVAFANRNYRSKPICCDLFEHDVLAASPNRSSF